MDTIILFTTLPLVGRQPSKKKKKYLYCSTEHISTVVVQKGCDYDMGGQQHGGLQVHVLSVSGNLGVLMRRG